VGKKRARWRIDQLLDLTKYEIERVERWPGWGKLFLKQKRSEYTCPGCKQKYFWCQSRRWRLLRDLDILCQSPRSGMKFGVN